MNSGQTDAEKLLSILKEIFKVMQKECVVVCFKSKNPEVLDLVIEARLIFPAIVINENLKFLIAKNRNKAEEKWILISIQFFSNGLVTSAYSWLTEDKEKAFDTYAKVQANTELLKTREDFIDLLKLPTHSIFWD